MKEDRWTREDRFSLRFSSYALTSRSEEGRKEDEKLRRLVGKFFLIFLTPDFLIFFWSIVRLPSEAVIHLPSISFKVRRVRTMRTEYEL